MLNSVWYLWDVKIFSSYGSLLNGSGCNLEFLIHQMNIHGKLSFICPCHFRADIKVKCLKILVKTIKDNSSFKYAQLKKNEGSTFQYILFKETTYVTYLDMIFQHCKWSYGWEHPSWFYSVVVHMFLHYFVVFVDICEHVKVALTVVV